MKKSRKLTLASKKTSDDIIVIGCFGKAVGLKGMIRVKSFTEPKENILKYQPWLVKSNQKWRTMQYKTAAQQGKLLVVSMEGVNDRNESEALTNSNIAIYRHQLPELDDEFYWADLEGLTVVNKQGDIFGIVSHLIATGSNDVMVVKAENKAHMIPYLLNDVVLDIDLTDSIIVVDWDLEF
jgi:16S rRNA processing protein RimM